MSDEKKAGYGLSRITVGPPMGTLEYERAAGVVYRGVKRAGAIRAALDGVPLRDGVSEFDLEDLITFWVEKYDQVYKSAIYPLGDKADEAQALDKTQRRTPAEESRLKFLCDHITFGKWFWNSYIESAPLILSAIIRAASTLGQHERELFVARALPLFEMALPVRKRSPGDDEQEDDHRRATVHSRIMRRGGYGVVDVVAVPALRLSKDLRRPRSEWKMYAFTEGPSCGLHLLMLNRQERNPKMPPGVKVLRAEKAEAVMALYPWPIPKPHPTRRGWAIVPTAPGFDACSEYPDPDARSLPPDKYHPRKLLPPVLTLKYPPL